MKKITYLCFSLFFIITALYCDGDPLRGNSGSEGGPLREAEQTDSEAQAEMNRYREVIRAVATPRIVNPEGGVYPLEGIILAKGGTELYKIPREHGVHIDLDKQDYLGLKQLLEFYLNQPLQFETIQKIKATIVDYFFREKNTYVAAIIPVQEVSDGVLIIEILEGRIGQINYIGQKWFSEWALKRGLEVKKGDPLIERQLLNYLSWVNRNPFHHLELVLQPGQEKGTTDIEFYSEERFPVRFFSGSDNTGFLANGGQTRLFAGFNWGNALQIGDILSYQYTASPNFHGFQSHVLSYTSMLSWKHVFTLLGCYGQVFPTIPDFDTVGRNIQGSIRYDVPIKPLYGDFRSMFTGGFDFKYQNSNLFFTGNTDAVFDSTQTINVTQFLLEYSFQQNWSNQAISFDAKFFASLWKDWWFPYQTSTDYDILRPGSHVRYAYLRTSVSDHFRFKSGWLLSGMFRLQLASNTLPSSEQFTLGGASTVRGYYEQQFLADNAFCFNIESYAPALSLFDSFHDELLFMVFFDYGYGRNYSALSAPYIAQNLVGIGPGVHYNIAPYFNVKVEYGFQVIGIPQDHRFGRFHLSITGSY